MAVDKLINETQGNDIIDRLDDIASNLENVAAIIPAKFGMGLATCDTAADTAAKTCTIPNFALTNGAPVSVKFAYANTASNATLNINGTGAKPMYYKGNPLGSSVISAGDIATFVYSSAGVYHIINIDTLTGAGTGTVTQIGAENGLITDQTGNADIQRDGKIGLNLKSTTAFSSEVGAHNTSTDNMYPVALDSAGHPVAAVSNATTSAEGVVQLTNSVGTSSGASETDVPTEKAVAEAIESIGKPMVWTGTITLTADSTDTTKCSIAVSKPASAADIKNGYTYRIGSIAASPVYTGPYKVGDTFIASKDEPTVTASWIVGTDWDYTPSGDEPSGTVTGVKMTSAGTTIDPDGNGVVTLTEFVGSGTGHKAGLVPDTGSSTAGTTKYLREDGTWVVPPGSGGGNSILLNGNTVHPEVRDITSEVWESKTWSGMTSFDGWYVWSNGTDIFYSNGNTQKVLNKSTNTWSDITWNVTIERGHNVWSDGENIYYSGGINGGQYVFDKTTNNWVTKTWSGSGNYIQGYCIWYDGDVFHYDYAGDHMVRNKSTGEWETKTWTGVDYLYGRYIWSDDGETFYYSTDGNQQYVLNKATSTWSEKTWTGLTNFNGYDVWSDGKNVYYSSGSNQYVLDKASSTWTSVTWTGLSSFNGERIWSDGDKLHYSNSSNQYILKRNTPTTVELLGCIGDVHSIIREVL